MRSNPARRPDRFEIEGRCDPRFEPVRQAFAQNFEKRGEVGAAVAITLHNEPVVDLWGGYKDADYSLPWRADTISCVQSVSKEITALALHMAADREQIDIEGLVVDVWPEYGQAGKEGTTIRWLLDHRAGVPVAEGSTPGMGYDCERMAEALARTTPLWQPGSTPCYHSATYGFLVAELLRRASGKTIGRFLTEEIAEPFGLDCHIGLSPAENERVAPYLDKELHPSQTWIEEGDNIFARSWKIFWDDEDFNSAEWRSGEVPTSNMHTNARALARLCGILANGGEIDGRRLIGRDSLARAGETQWSGVDIQGRPLGLALGFLKPVRPFEATGPNALFFSGAGGPSAFADPDTGIGFGYTMNSMDPDLTYPRPAAFVEALKICLAKL